MAYWVVVSCVERDSKLMPNSSTWRIEFENCHTRQRTYTYVEARFKNSANWYSLINSWPRGLIVTNLKPLKDSIIDADSIPQIVFDVSQQELLDILEEHWR